MPLRELTDGAGAVWQVWEVRPGAVLLDARERRRPKRSGEDRRVVQAPGLDPADDRRSGRDRRVSISEPPRRGWLAFRNAQGERRRLAPEPPAWEAVSDAELAALCRAAERTE